MRYHFKKYPIDILLLLLWGLIALPIVLLNVNDALRIIIGLPILLFIPGYLLIFLLFPMKKEFNGINTLERIGLSFVFSIALVSLLGLLMNFTPWGIQLLSVLFSQIILLECLGFFALYRWNTTHPEKRITITLDVPAFKSSRIAEKILILFVLLSVFIALSSIAYIIIQPKPGEAFTNFYILTSDGKAMNYPRDIYAKINTTLRIGLINHEYKTMNYTIEVWLIDETTIYNESTKKNDTIYNHAWFKDEIVVHLNHTNISNDKNQIIKWEQPYTFMIDQMGHYKLAFLLFTTPSEGYDANKDYKDSIRQKINTAYRELHLWLNVG